MPEQPVSFSDETIRTANGQTTVPPVALARWASVAARLSTGAVIPSQPAA